MNTQDCLGIIDWRRLNQYFRWHKIYDDDGTMIARGKTIQGRFAWCYTSAAKHDFHNLCNSARPINMMKILHHSPIPWSIGYGGDSDTATYIMSGDDIIATLDSRSSEIDTGNAETIILAVNGN